MKKFKRYSKILSLVLALQVLLAVFSQPQAEEYSVPTLYIDNQAWHMSSLFSLTEQDGTYLVPTSFFEAVNGVEISFDQIRSCLLVQYGENYISLNVKTQNALLSTGELKKTTVSYINDEYFIDSELCAKTLGFEVELATFKEKNILRLKTEKDLLDLQLLAERNQVSDSTPPDKTDSAQITIERQEKTLAFIVDFTKMSEEEQSEIISFMTEKNICPTVIIEKENLTDPTLLKNLLSAYSHGCSFIIRAKNTLEVGECNGILRTLLQGVTRLVAGPDSLKSPLEAIGYIAMGKATAKVSENPNNYNFQSLTTVEIADFTIQTKSSIEKWTAAAKENEVFIAPLNQKTGN